MMISFSIFKNFISFYYVCCLTMNPIVFLLIKFQDQVLLEEDLYIHHQVIRPDFNFYIKKVYDSSFIDLSRLLNEVYFQIFIKFIASTTYSIREFKIMARLIKVKISLFELLHLMG